MTPSAAARPNADPPLNTTASTRSTSRPGASRSVSRVAGAAPRTSPPPTVPDGARITVTPDPAPVHGPTRMSAMSGIMDAAGAVRSRRYRRPVRWHPRREPGDELVDPLGVFEHEHVPATRHPLDFGVRDVSRDPAGLGGRSQQI